MKIRMERNHSCSESIESDEKGDWVRYSIGYALVLCNTTEVDSIVIMIDKELYCH